MRKEVSDQNSLEDADEKIDTSPTRKIDLKKSYSTHCEKKAFFDQKDVFENAKELKQEN